MILIQPWQEASKAAFAIRHKVFIEEQGVPEDLELDEFDQLAMHALAFQGSECVGTGRLVNIGGQNGLIGRMAVLPRFRNNGFGRAILKKLMDQAQEEGIVNLMLHSQVTAIPFYEKQGFQIQGGIYDEAGIPHRNMIHLLPK
ncbi:GNAT family N-acetyltransferase [Polynucleobacter sp. AP-Melu-500A-A1]|uniref:GNAT family N-acetyltransferase n=1 Tax=Polynucleobacter sp. AP-Melu-500A-A1 TaxID=2576929 RepID=UPI00351CD9FA|nr:GNAT family N-acetyltransferase [Polynucleobacter sp. AP-Melu-500A-A1]